MTVEIPAHTEAEIHVPVSDAAGARISVDGKLVFQDGKKVGEAEGIQLEGPSDAAVVFRAGAGRYTFVAE